MIHEKAGTIVVATGLEPYDPRAMDEYGYTRFENVVTSVEFERLVNAGGPTRGELVRPTDRTLPKEIGFVQCVGSRSRRRGGEHCSNICCMNTIKSTLILKEHYPDMDIKVFYMDIRAFGKGFEALYNRSHKLGVKYLRGLPGSVEELSNGSLRVAVENMATARVEFHDLGMLVLALGLNSARCTQQLQEILGLQLTPDGFYLEAHPKLLPLQCHHRGCQEKNSGHCQHGGLCRVRHLRGRMPGRCYCPEPFHRRPDQRPDRCHARYPACRKDCCVCLQLVLLCRG
ncbi:hypothetical protein HRM2_06460 [Desulforapulum autotrophicum HRM2]|uniref:Uncharacterized protein n=1 Tax=Desulforapulum autotrophicum (strain ATCC 43914 / DSM 3382 / VKM B-1955 / HRM2) TaxID=177437 RepID=C0QIX0_DESAH|nr:hypothetical protein HRM2_06460 [Desulforapulum autotrophicum HRM2]